MKFSAPSTYLRATDLPPDQDTVVTIVSFAQERFDQKGRTVDKWVLFFKELPGGLPLNKATGKAICDQLGDEMGNWIGKQIVLYVDPNVQYEGKQVSGIRIRPC